MDNLQWVLKDMFANTNQSDKCTKWRYYCSSSDTRNRPVHSDKKSWNYYKCGLCGTLRIDEFVNVTNIYENEKIKTKYTNPKLIIRFKHKLLGHPIERVTGISNFKNHKILDIGCGNGQKLYEFYKKNSKDVYGTEMGEKKLDVARHYMPEGTFFSGDLSRSNFPKKYFDIIIADNVMEHVENPISFFRNLVEYLNPKGQLIIYVPNGSSLSVIMFKNKSLSIWPPFHVNLFTKKYFLHNFNNVNLKFKTKTHYFTFKQSMVRFGIPKIIANFLALLLMPVAKEELIVLAKLN